MLALAFGDDDARERTLSEIRAIHRRVHGALRHGVGRFAAGTPYSAEDPALLLWVHATLLDSTLLAYDRLVTPLSLAERDAYCEEAASIAVALGVRDADVPRTWDAIAGYMETMIQAGPIAVGPDARQLAAGVLAPPLAYIAWPAVRVNRLVTIGLLPSKVRTEYGFTWSARDERRLTRVLRIIRNVRRATPATIALWRDARRCSRS
jgi:uncharacterized protein (DUF2236 family)